MGNLATHTPYVVESVPLGRDYMYQMACRNHEKEATFDEESADCEAPIKQCDTLKQTLA